MVIRKGCGPTRLGSLPESLRGALWGGDSPRAPGPPVLPPPRPAAPAHVHHSLLLGSHHLPDSVLSAQDAKTNLPGCQGAAGAPHRPLPTPPHPPALPPWHTAHGTRAAVRSQRVVCRTWHLLGFSHLCALLLCTFWSSPRIRLSPSLTLADTYLACKTPFWPCFYQEAFCNAHRLGMIPSCSPCVPTY